MYILHFREFCENCLKFIMVKLLTRFDFTHIKMSNTSDCILRMNNSRGFPLSFRQDDVNKVFG
ncbi:unnamed protein product [Schistosoma mattheei]|uniref:Uncharacterized protein n=1 Tax=Schistosoma mattheei TaxID=31246 RepID=A0A183NPB4_9TREM|nr:unnamed protein product [Schistosoma mattheei]